MYKYWYAAEKEGTFYIGLCYGWEENTDAEVVEVMQEYCRRKAYRLTLLVQIVPIGIVNQIYPCECTEETLICMEGILSAAMQ